MQPVPVQNLHNYKICKKEISESNQATTYYFADNYKMVKQRGFFFNN